MRTVCHCLLNLAAITCSQLSAIVNGGPIDYSDIPVNKSSDLSVGTVATYHCSEGFSLVGDVKRVCGGNGSSPAGVWSGSQPVCLGRVCASTIHTVQ